MLPSKGNSKSKGTMLFQAFKEVFGRFRFIALALVAGFAAFEFTVWFPNLGLIVHTMMGDASLGIKAELLYGLSAGISTNFTPLSATYTTLIAILFGVNLTMIVYYVMKRKSFGRQALAVSSGAVASGALGIGCAACGSLVGGYFLAFFGASGVATLLPLKGEEFGILSVLLFGISTYVIARKIVEPAVCKPSY